MMQACDVLFHPLFAVCRPRDLPAQGGHDQGGPAIQQAVAGGAVTGAAIAALVVCAQYGIEGLGRSLAQRLDKQPGLVARHDGLVLKAGRTFERRHRANRPETPEVGLAPLRPGRSRVLSARGDGNQPGSHNGCDEHSPSCVRDHGTAPYVSRPWLSFWAVAIRGMTTNVTNATTTGRYLLATGLAMNASSLEASSNANHEARIRTTRLRWVPETHRAFAQQSSERHRARWAPR